MKVITTESAEYVMEDGTIEKLDFEDILPNECLKSPASLSPTEKIQLLEEMGIPINKFQICNIVWDRKNSYTTGQKDILW